MIAHAEAQLKALIAAIPAGYVASYAAIARQLKLDQRHVRTMLHGLGSGSSAAAPWWRIVADGGAIGRHPLRDSQIALLSADGVPVSPVGIVQEMSDRLIVDLGNPRVKPFAAVSRTATGAPSRSRGMKNHPGTT